MFFFIFFIFFLCNQVVHKKTFFFMEQHLSFFSNMYASPRVLLEGKYVTSYADQWTDDPTSSVLTMSHEVVLWTHAASSSSPSSLVETMLTVVLACRLNGCTSLNMLVGVHGASVLVAVATDGGHMNHESSFSPGLVSGSAARWGSTFHGVYGAGRAVGNELNVVAATMVLFNLWVGDTSLSVWCGCTHDVLRSVLSVPRPRVSVVETLQPRDECVSAWVPVFARETGRIVKLVSAATTDSGTYMLFDTDTQNTDQERLLHYSEPWSLFVEARASLLLLAQKDDASGWLREKDDGNSLVRALTVRRARGILQRTITVQDLLTRLEDENLSLRECDGCVFDILFMSPGDRTTAELLQLLPQEWQPREFYLAGDVGFLSMLYLLQWRSSLQRFMELAICADMESVLMTAMLQSFRTGIVWQVEPATPLYSDVREVIGANGSKQYIFLFNPSPSTLNLRPSRRAGEVVSEDWMVVGSLQTQSAKQRDSVIAFFMAQAVLLVSRVIESRGKVSDVAATLIGLYMGCLHDVDLKHSYKQWQRVIRELRQTIPTKKRRATPVAAPSKKKKKPDS